MTIFSEMLAISLSNSVGTKKSRQRHSSHLIQKSHRVYHASLMRKHPIAYLNKFPCTIGHENVRELSVNEVEKKIIKQKKDSTCTQSLQDFKFMADKYFLWTAMISEWIQISH